MDRNESNEESRESVKRLREYAETAAILVAEGDIGMAAGFLPGARIEVLWSVCEDEESSDSEDVWWPATVVGRTSRRYALADYDGEMHEELAEIESLPVYEIRYDAREPEFPKPEISGVCLLGEHHLLDTSSEKASILQWRMEGSNWEESDSEEVEENSIPATIQTLLSMMGDDNSAVLNASESLSQEQCREMAVGFVDSILESLRSRHKTDFENLPRDRQNAIVDRFVEIKEVLINKVAGCLKETGQFTEEDARRIVTELRTA